MGRSGFGTGRARVAACLIGVVAAAALAPSPAIRAAAVLVVNSTADDGGACEQPPVGDCTLREAIAAANAIPGADLIGFAIPGNGPHTIAPLFALPTVTERVTIDGYTQGDDTAATADDTRENTLVRGSNAVLKIELNGSGAGPVDGLTIAAANSVVRGLAINRFLRGIRIEGAAATGVTVAGNFVGTDPSGELDRGNTYDGLIVLGVNALIGGGTRAARNVISGNDADGITIANQARRTRVEGNLIGFAADGETVLVNDEDGVVVGPGSTGNRILGNAIGGNGALGINLRGGTENGAGVTANDPRDPDRGANDLQNFPVLASATTTGGGTTITGTLASRPGRSFAIQFFASPADGRRQGRTLIGQRRVVTDADGNARFSVPLASGRIVPVGQAVTATATDEVSGDTSEFSAPRLVT